MKSLTTLTTLFQFTITKMKYLTTLATVFLLLLLLKWILWLRSLRCFTSLLLKWYLWLRSLHCFTFTTIKMKSLTTFSTLFYFTTTNPRDRTTLTTLLLSLIHQIVFPQEFQCFHKICMCHSNFTVRKFSGVLHALLPLISEMKWVPVLKHQSVYCRVHDFYYKRCFFVKQTLLLNYDKLWRW